MKDFLDGLDDRLRSIAEAQAAELAPVPTPAETLRRHRRRRPALLAGLTGALATAGAVFAMNGVSMADLPILETRTVDASGVSTAAEPARAAGVDFSEAHPFPTVNGPGYVFQTPDGTVICVSIPDPEGRYPGACAPRKTVEQRGLSVEFSGDLGIDRTARSLFAFVLPDDASEVQVNGPGNGAVTITSGVAVGSIAQPVTIDWTEDGRARSVSIEGPFPADSTTTETCPDGRTIVGPLSELRPPPAARLDQDALRKACR